MFQECLATLIMIALQQLHRKQHNVSDFGAGGGTTSKSNNC